MNVKNETHDQAIVIEDLSAENAEAIRGGGDDKRQDYIKITLEEVIVS